MAFPDISLWVLRRVRPTCTASPSGMVPLKADFTLDAGGLSRPASEPLCSPTPTPPPGLALSRDAGRGDRPGQTRTAVVVVDEAYVDFGGESAVPLTARYPNLLVVQTFSKSRSMAGARLGYAIGDAALIQDLEAIRFSTNPYNVNRLTLRAGAAALAEQALLRRQLRGHRGHPRRYRAAAGDAGLHAAPTSRANFLFARHPAADGGGPLPEAQGARGAGAPLRRPAHRGLYPHHHRYQGPDGRPTGDGWRDCYENRPTLRARPMRPTSPSPFVWTAGGERHSERRGLS
ncbi:MAG: aminotransferase class I/II-fold pyridoxal phosphate-dependent enzyme [Lawsonibacter sp.]